MDDITIREYKDEDWEYVKILILETHSYGPSVLKSEKKRIEFYLQVPEKGKTFVVEVTRDIVEKDSQNENDKQRDNIIGYIVIDFFGRGIYILSLVVATEWQRKGIGTKLVNYAKKYGKDNPQYNMLRGYAEDHLTGVHTFLLQQGFKTCGFVNHDIDLNRSTIHYVFPLREEDDNEPEMLISA
ncbi:MAG: GNAT family N-acetyltransferase [Candidatus Hodarchaeota archaeon]